MGLRGLNKISNQRQAILLALAFSLNSSGLMETHWKGHNRNKDEQIHWELKEKKKVHVNKENIQFHITNYDTVICVRMLANEYLKHFFGWRVMNDFSLHLNLQPRNTHTGDSSKTSKQKAIYAVK